MYAYANISHLFVLLWFLASPPKIEARDFVFVLSSAHDAYASPSAHVYAYAHACAYACAYAYAYAHEYEYACAH